MASRMLGYVRTASTQSDIEAQVAALRAAGCQEIFTDIAISGNASNRPGLNRLRSSISQGDHVIVVDLPRLSRSVQDTFDLLEELRQKGATFATLDQAA